MATTSSNLTAGAASGGRDGNGQGRTGRAAGLIATAALGLSLLTGVAFNQLHRPAPTTPAAAPYRPTEPRRPRA